MTTLLMYLFIYLGKDGFSLANHIIRKIRWSSIKLVVSLQRFTECKIQTRT